MSDKTPTKLDPRSVKALVEGIGDGLFFSVTFQKKDGTMRTMTCRKGVKKGVKGVGLKYNPKDYSLLVVYDIHKQAFRTIRLDTISEVKVHGDFIEVED